MYLLTELEINIFQKEKSDRKKTRNFHMPYETPVYLLLSFAAPPYARREPLQKPEEKDNQL